MVNILGVSVPPNSNNLFRMQIKMKKKIIDWRIVCTGLVCLTGLECFALSQGINGWLLRIVVMAIATIIGVTIPTPNIKH